MNDRELLKEFGEQRSQDAFRQLVERHLPMVYSAAKRIVLDAHLAEEVAQNVFTLLAQKAGEIRENQVIGGWLYNTTRHLSLHAIRSEHRRREREQTAYAMQSLNASSAEPAPNRILEELEPVMGELDETDRTAVVLRFLEDRPLREVGAELGLTEDAARMRVNRALDRLRGIFERRGIAVTGVALGAILAQSTVAVPAGLALAIGAALPFPAVVSAPGWLSPVQKVFYGKAGALTGVVVVMVGLITFSRFKEAKNDSAARQNSSAQTIDASVASRADGTNGAQNRLGSEIQPDPVELLKGVVRARQRVAAGSMDFQSRLQVIQADGAETNEIKGNALFDGHKLRFEQVGREYRYTAVGEEASEAAQAKIKALKLDRAGAEREGLLQGFEAHDVAIYDGDVLMRYRETDGKPESAVISKPENALSLIFDPRTLGLSVHLSMTGSPEAALGYADAKSVTIAGIEPVDGIPAWRIEVVSKADDKREFWIDRAHPERVLKCSTMSGVIYSKYSDATLANSIPVEVIANTDPNRVPYIHRQFTRSNPAINIPVNPSSFTLAGLNMQIGTDVIDYRIHRRIGYWTGSELSEDLPGKNAEPKEQRNLAELSATLENDPGSAEGLEAAKWILLNTPDGPVVEKAAEVIFAEHLQSSNLLDLTVELGRVRHRCSTNLLAALLKENPHADIKATACFTLATLLKDEANFGVNQRATREAEKLFERVINDFHGAGGVGRDLARRARPELYELRNVIIGKPAPETAGVDLNGEPLNLRSYRGKVVLLCFWTESMASSISEYGKLLARMEGKNFAFVGVNCDEKLSRAQAAAEKHEFNWPSFWDQRDGPISKAWNVNSWISLFVIDQQGIIRHRNLRWKELDDAVDALLEK